MRSSVGKDVQLFLARSADAVDAGRWRCASHAVGLLLGAGWAVLYWWATGNEVLLPVAVVGDGSVWWVWARWARVILDSELVLEDILAQASSTLRLHCRK